MAVRCSKCGEELLGPVNRCWKCGQTFATLPDAGGLPPVRRDVEAAPAPAVAAVSPAHAEPATADPAGEETPVRAEAVELVPSPSASSGAPVRTGSPFSPGAAAALKMAGSAMVSPAKAARPARPVTQDLIRDKVAVAGAIGSLVLGGFSLAVSWMQNPSAVIGGALLAAFGMAMGIWGLHSKRRGWALFGMLICVGAISLASYSGAMILYQLQLDAKEMEGRIE